MQYVPLAERLRPKRIDQVIGHDQLLNQLIDQKVPMNLILWGPPGSGKTTIARLLASSADTTLIELSAVVAKKSDILAAITMADENAHRGLRTTLFVDELHRFSKAQQDSLLPSIEQGRIVFIGATTENPSFEIIPPLMSRTQLIVLQPLTDTNIVTILTRARKTLELDRKIYTKAYLQSIATHSGGDARVALTLLEMTLNQSPTQPLTAGSYAELMQSRPPSYDKQADQHYEFISAFIKSLRAGEVDAALFYLARMLAGGEDPKVIARRMIIFASEDIGMAAPAALNLAVSTFLAVERIGLPEANYSLYHCAIVLAKTHKSRAVVTAMSAAQQAAKRYPNVPVPLHLRNAPTDLLRQMHYGKGQKWEAGFHNDAPYLPEEVAGLKFFVDDF